MYLREFDPSQTEEDQILSTINPSRTNPALDKTLFPIELGNSQELLSEMYQQGFRFLAVRDPSQAYLVLKHSPYVTKLAQRFGKTNIHIYEIKIPEHRWNPDVELGIAGYTKIKKPKPEYFEEIRSRYTEWRVGWWREILQNSVDACIEGWKNYGRRGVITCEIRHFESGKVEVVVEDNGVGMNIQTLTDAFLTLGGTAKREGADAAGGLGKAKELLFHSWESWAVHTRTDEMAPSDGLFVRGKYSPNHFPPCLRNEKGFQINQGQTQAECKKSWIGALPKKTPGTMIIVRMTEQEHVNKEDLEKFINLSHLPQIVVRFKETYKKGDEYFTASGETPTWETLTALNQTAKTPVILLRRADGTGGKYAKEHADGSPWGAVYHTPGAKKFTDPKVIVRAKGLFMFTPGETGEGFNLSTENIKGKVIIELLYRPKGYVWNPEAMDWDLMAAEQAEKQDFKAYGPLEILGESRDTLKGNYMMVLNQFMEKLRTDPKQTLKRRRPPRIIRTKNKWTTPKDWDKIFEEVETYEIPTSAGMSQTLNTLKDIHIKEAIEKATEVMAELDFSIDADLDDWDTSEVADLLGKKLTANQIITLQGVGFGIPALAAKIKKIETAIDTSADFDLWNDKLLPSVRKDAKDAIASAPLSKWEKEKREQVFTENLIKWLSWEPDFLLHDEAGAAEVWGEEGESTKENNPNVDTYGHLIKRAPDHFSPEQFRWKEKRIAKLWVECIRLAFILIGKGSELIDPDKLELPLQAGFYFENWESEEDLETLGMYRTHTGDGNERYRALLLAPALLRIEEKGNRWIHRYSMSSNRDFALFISIVFHEVAHAIHNISSLTSDWEHNQKPRRSHDDEFASILTHEGVKLAFSYSNLFNKIRAEVASAYPKDGSSSGSSSSVKKEKMLQSRGYYHVTRPVSTKGPEPEFATLAEALAYIDEKWGDHKGVGVEARYWTSQGGTKRSDRKANSHYLSKVHYPDPDDSWSYGIADVDQGLSRIRESWDEKFGDPDDRPYWADYEDPDELGDTDSIWRRNR